MENHASWVAAGILRADDLFLAEVGRLTQRFSYIEDSMAYDALNLLQFVGDGEMKGASASKITRFRILEKRDFLRRVCAEISRFYGVDHSRVGKILDELGNINRLRRTVVHGSIQWSAADEMPVFVDSHGHSVPAWPQDIADLNLKVLNWVHEYHSEQGALLRAVLRAWDRFADRLLQRPGLSAKTQGLLRQLKAKAARATAE